MVAVNLDPELDDDDDDLVALRVELPHHPAASSELLWGESRGPQTFALRCIPQYAYGLSWGDVVTTQTREDGQHIVTALASASGHQTLRLTFLRRTRPRDRLPMLDALRPFGVSYEGSPSGPVAIDVPPSSDIEPVIAQLIAWQDEGLLYCETCEARSESGFDDVEAADAEDAMERMLRATRDYQHSLGRRC